MNLQKGQHIDRRKERRDYLNGQMELARRLDKVCLNPNCDKTAFLSWILDIHHINGRGEEFLGIEHILSLCRACHTLVGIDIDLMIKILEYHEGKSYYRWTNALVELRKKRDYLIYKRGVKDGNRQ